MENQNRIREKEEKEKISISVPLFPFPFSPLFFLLILIDFVRNKTDELMGSPLHTYVVKGSIHDYYLLFPISENL